MDKGWNKAIANDIKAIVAAKLASHDNNFWNEFFKKHNLPCEIINSSSTYRNIGSIKLEKGSKSESISFPVFPLTNLSKVNSGPMLGEDSTNILDEIRLKLKSRL